MQISSFISRFQVSTLCVDRPQFTKSLGDNIPSLWSALEGSLSKGLVGENAKCFPIAVGDVT
jgi:hypothetical protein